MSEQVLVAYDVTGIPRRVLVDATGRLVVSPLIIGGVTIADGDDAAEGAIADAIVAAGAVGTVSAKLRRLTQGVEDLKTTIVLAGGSIVDIRNTTKTILRASINIAAAGVNVIVAAPGAGAIKIVHLSIQNPSVNQNIAILLDGAATMNGTGFLMLANGGAYTFDAPGGLFPMVLSATTAFNINLSAASQINGILLYYVE